MNSFVKLFNSILTSSIWLEDNETRILWITMLAMSDKDGYVSGSVPGMARFAGISLEGARTGIEKLKGPDDESRTKEFEGRRIEEVDGGWKIINHHKYRQLMSKEERKEYNRTKQAEHRAKKRED